MLYVFGNTLCYRFFGNTLCYLQKMICFETCRWVVDVFHVTSAHGCSLICGESLCCVTSSPLSKCFLYELWYAVLRVQEWLLNIMWHTRTPLLYWLILCAHCIPYRIVSYENWFPVASNTFQKFCILPLAIQVVQNNIRIFKYKDVLINEMAAPNKTRICN